MHERLLWPVLLLLPLMAASALWSEEPLVTLKSAMSFGLVAVQAILLFRGMSLDEALNSLGAALAPLIAVQLVAVVAFPAVGVLVDPQEPGAWSGTFLHRNYLAFFVMLATITYVGIWLSLKRRSLGVLLGLASCIALLVGSRSQTGLVLSTLSLLVLMLVEALARASVRLKLPTMAVALLSLIVAAVASVTYSAEILASLGRDASLSGRVYIWRAVGEMIAQRPILGWGWQAVWGPSDTVYQAVYADLGASIPHAHSGYLDFALQLGYVGLVLIVLAVVLPLLSVFRSLITHRGSGGGAWLFAALFFMLAANVSETRLTRELGFFFLTSLVLLAAQYVSEASASHGAGVRNVAEGSSVRLAARSAGPSRAFPRTRDESTREAR